MEKTVEQAKAAHASAPTAYPNELERDSERNEGNGAQERRREDHQESLRGKIRDCQREPTEAERIASGAMISDDSAPVQRDDRRVGLDETGD